MSKKTLSFSDTFAQKREDAALASSLDNAGLVATESLSPYL